MIRVAVLMTVLSCAAFATAAAAEPKLAWDLSELYPTEAEWSKALDAAVADIPKIEGCRGTLTRSAATLLGCLDTYFDIDRRLTKVGVYASMNYDLDTRVGRAQQMQEQARQARTAFAAATAWLRPEIIAAGADKIRALDGRRAAPRAVQAAARRHRATRAAHARRGIRAHRRRDGADGERGPVDPRRVRQRRFPVPDGQADKRRGGEARRGGLHEVPRGRRPRGPARGVRRRSGRATTSTRARSAPRSTRRSRRTSSPARCASSTRRSTEALFGDNIPTAVYTQLIADIHANLADAAPLPAPSPAHDGPRQARLRGPLRPDRQALRPHVHPRGGDGGDARGRRRARQGVPGDPAQGHSDGGWIDWFPRTGKRSGAYSTGAYGLHPFQLQNFTGLYDEVSTLAHESGHSMHSFLSDRAQPYPTHDYPIFIAEVASTLNENLLCPLDARRRRKPTTSGCSCSAATSTACAPRCSARGCSPSSSCASTSWRRAASR